MWNQSQGVLGEDGRGCVAIRVGHVGGAVPLEQHPAGLYVYLLDEAVDHPLVGGAAHGCQVRGRRGAGHDQRCVPRRYEELVEGVRGSVARPDRGNLAVPVVVDVVGAAGAVRAHLGFWGRVGTSALGQARGRRRRGRLEPGEDRLAQVALGSEVGGDLPGRQPVEPDHLPGGGDDLGACRVATSGRGDEDVPAAAGGVAGQHGERRRRVAGSRVSAPGGASRPRRRPGEGEADDRQRAQSPAPRPPRGVVTPKVYRLCVGSSPTALVDAATAGQAQLVGLTEDPVLAPGSPWPWPNARPWCHARDAGSVGVICRCPQQAAVFPTSPTRPRAQGNGGRSQRPRRQRPPGVTRRGLYCPVLGGPRPAGTCQAG